MSAKMTKLAIIKVVKDFLLATRLLQILQPLNRLFFFIYNFNLLTSWVHRNKKANLLTNDFYRPVRKYEEREKSFNALINHYGLNDAGICYLEFGVAQGNSIKWWLKNCTHPDSVFYGFDTFEGLPEAWGVFNKGDMSSAIPIVNDNRAAFIKGIFQDTFNDFLSQHASSFPGKRLVIHMDADLFSATLFVLSQLYPYLKKGDLIMFDEFNVYDHEFMAYRIFTDCFYLKLKPVSAQNNFYHTAFEVE